MHDLPPGTPLCCQQRMASAEVLLTLAWTCSLTTPIFEDVAYVIAASQVEICTAVKAKGCTAQRVQKQNISMVNNTKEQQWPPFLSSSSLEHKLNRTSSNTDARALTTWILVHQQQNIKNFLYTPHCRPRKVSRGL